MKAFEGWLNPKKVNKKKRDLKKLRAKRKIKNKISRASRKKNR